MGTVRPTTGVMIGIAVVALIAASLALNTPWYSMSGDTDHWKVGNQTISVNGTSTFYPGANYRFDCTALPTNALIWGPLCAVTQGQAGGLLQPYSDLNGLLGTPSGGVPPGALGALYGAVEWVSILAIVIGVGAVGLSLAILRRGAAGGLPLGAVAVFALAGALALGAGIGVAILQPAAIANDCKGGSLSCPTNPNFWGSCGPSPSSCGNPASSNYTLSNSWYPHLGWYLEVFAGALFLGAAVLGYWKLIRRRRPRPSTPESPSGG